MKTHGICALLICLLLVSASLAEPPVPVVCPAAHDCPEEFPELVMVVRGSAHPDMLGKYEVVRVLYGSYSEKTILICPPGELEIDAERLWPDVKGDFIVALTPPINLKSKTHHALACVCYWLPISEERAEVALYKARLDYAVLASSCIFVGNRTEPVNIDVKAGDRLVIGSGHRILNNTDGNDKIAVAKIISHAAEVACVIYGETLRPGQRILLDEPVGFRYDIHRIDTKQQIFCVSPINGTKPKTIYKVYTHLPLNHESKIPEALGRREKYPIIEDTDPFFSLGMMGGRGGMGGFGIGMDGDWFKMSNNKPSDPNSYAVITSIKGKTHQPDTKKYREIIFLGSNAEAIELLGAQHDKAFELFRRTLLHRRKTARPGVVAAVEREMFRTSPPPGARQGEEYLHLHRLIDLLGEMQRADGGDDIERLIDTYLSHIERNGPAPASDPQWDDWDEVELSDETNHALTWLLMKLNRRQCGEKFGERLMALRSKAEKQWQKEIRTAVDAVGIEDTLALIAAKKEMGNIEPVRYPTKAAKIFFDRDGKRIRTIGEDNLVRTWELTNKKMLGRVEIPAKHRLVGAREWDGRYLICAKVNQETYNIHKDGPLLIIDSDSGKIIAETDVPGEYFYFWANDRETLCLKYASDNEVDIYRFDYRNGKVLNTWKSFSKEGDSHLLLEEYFWHWTEDGRLYCIIYDFDDSAFEEYLDDRGQLENAVPSIRTAVFDPKTGRFEYNHNRIVSSDLPLFTDHTGLVPGGKYFYLIDDGISIYDRRTLKSIWTTPLKEMSIGQFAFSDDGKLLAVSTAHLYSWP